MTDHPHSPSPSFAEHYLGQVSSKLPVVRQILQQYGHVPLGTYFDRFSQITPPPYQPREDVWDCIYEYAAPLLGKTLAAQVIQDIAAYPVLLTANHLGVDYYSQFMQASLLMAVMSMSGVNNSKTVPVFSCGHIPLNNTAYPRGILVYQAAAKKLETLPVKLPIFPERLRSHLVSVLPSFDLEMLKRASSTVLRMTGKHLISGDIGNTLTMLLDEEYFPVLVRALPFYSQQCTLVNHRIWRRLFTASMTVPDLVYLEHEKILTLLLRKDLRNQRSLTWQVFFDAELRTPVLEALDGVPGCWEYRKLKQRYQTTLDGRTVRSVKGPLKRELELGGTVFFWAVDREGRRVPLFLDDCGEKGLFLHGVNDYGERLEFPFTPEVIIRNLSAYHLIPSGFTCFLPLAFARGIICVGGYFQCEYLPAMQKGLVSALQSLTRFCDIAEFVKQVPTDLYLFGMLGVLSNIHDEALVPAGPVEIITHGGLSKSDIERIVSLTVKDAHIAALYDSLLHDVSPDFSHEGWKHRLAESCWQLLEKKVVIR